MNKLSALNKVEEYIAEDLSWLKTGAREDTDWLMFVAYRIKSMMLNSVYKKNQAIMTYEKQELNEDYNDFLDMLWTMQDSGIFKFDWDRIWKQRDYQEIVDNIGLVTERFGYGVAVDLMNLINEFRFMQSDSEEFIALYSEYEKHMLPLLMLASGTVDLQSWRTLQETMPYALTKVANALEQSDYSSDVYIRGLHNLERVVESENTHIELFEECAKDLNEFVDDKNGGISFKYEVDEEIIKECVEKGFLKNKYYSGNYFRALYRCLKYIMDSDLEMEDKKFYSGVLRGILSSDEMLVVFYNCMYFEKGEKFKELLEREEDGKRIDFFGDKNDLKNLSEGYDLPFFSKEDLLFSETDMQKLEELIKGN